MYEKELAEEFNRMKIAHTHDRDSANNYGCYEVEACRNCNFVYNSRACLGCHNCDACIECVQCVDCKNCVYCVGLNGARFAILNVEYSEAEYWKRIEILGLNMKVDTGDFF
jgi:hypothetical protein